MEGPEADVMGTQEAEIAGGRKAVCADQGGNWRLFSDGAGRTSRRTRDLVAAGAPAFPEGARGVCMRLR